MTVNPYEPSRTPQPLAQPPPDVYGYEQGQPVEFELTLDDFIALQTDFAHRSGYSKALLGCTAVVAVLSVPVGVAVYLLTAEDTTMEMAWSLISFAVVNALVLSIVLYWFLRRPRANFLSGAILRTLFLRGDLSSILGAPHNSAD